jgi:hypothetical protein
VAVEMEVAIHFAPIHHRQRVPHYRRPQKKKAWRDKARMAIAIHLAVPKLLALEVSKYLN